MKRSWIAAVVFSLISVVQSYAYAKDLPDFTVLAETQGPAVVNIVLRKI
jgi:serine protease Do